MSPAKRIPHCGNPTGKFIIAYSDSRGVNGMPGDEELRQRARKTAEEKAGFYMHLGVYVGVNLFLIAIWWATGGPGTFPWFIFILFGWGIGLVAHFFGVFRGKAYVEQMAEKEYQRLKQDEGK
jgi:F0F1-type ATP synthase assembly protein I